MFISLSTKKKTIFPAIGTKGVARDMKKVCSGAQRDEGKTWFTELSDKGRGMCLF